MEFTTMEAKYEQTISLLSARKKQCAAKRHISYKKVILISNACQPAHVKDVRPQPVISIDKKPNPSKIPDIISQRMDFGYLTPSSDYKPML